jgi:hexosaminidase
MSPRPLILLAALLTASAFPLHAATLAEIQAGLMPLPSSVKAETGELTLNSSASITLGKGCEKVGRHFAERLRNGTGWAIHEKPDGVIRLELAPDAKASPESYSLQVGSGRVLVRAATPAGLARGVETLLQLMPTEVYGKNKCTSIVLPAVSIDDAPQFAWRGLHLDVSRKFQTKETILKLLDGIAACKLNIFHWHLTDDQGWRLPIEGYPKLTARGPAYTREDIREVVARAAELGITIVPEIDVPGHSSASGNAYPEISALNDKGKPSATLNVGADATYAFIDAVMKDVAAQFPDSPYIHIGADEVGGGLWKKDPQCLALMKKENIKGTHELYLHFVNRVVAIVKKHGRRAIAWDETLDKSVDPSLIIMSWRGMAPGVEAAKAGRQVVFTPTPALYLDHANTRSKENLRAYSLHPAYLNHIFFSNAGIPAIPADKRSLVMGTQLCIWSEVVTGDTHMLKLAFPRACAIAENLWMPRERLDWDGFVRRLEPQRKRLAAMDIPVFWEPESLAVSVGGWKAGEVVAKKGVIEISLPKFKYTGEQEFYAAQGVGDGQFKIESVELLKNGKVVATNKHDYESSMYKDTKQIYIVKNPDTDAGYSVRFKVKQLSGDCSAIVQYNPALAPEMYSKQCAPGSGSNGGSKEPGPTLLK